MQPIRERRTRHSACALLLASLLSAPAGAFETATAGGSSGAPYTLICPGAEVLVGIAGRSGSWIDQVGLVCMAVARDGQWRRVSASAAGIATGGESGDEFSLVCPRDSAVAAIRGIEGSYVDQVEIECRRLRTATHVAGDVTKTDGTDGEGGFGSTDFGPLRCADGRAATGLIGKSGLWVDSIGLRCISDSVWRPVYHFSPPHGWMNDPAGLVRVNGRYHLFYQAVPGSATFRAEDVHWSHATSPDLYRWSAGPGDVGVLSPYRVGLGVAVSPFTGSAVVVDDSHPDCRCDGAPNGRCLIALFTENVAVGLLPDQHQSMVDSCDGGRTFGHLRSGILVPDEIPHQFRDPKVFWYQDPDDPDRGYWVMVVVAGGKIGLYRSFEPVSGYRSRGTDRPNSRLHQWRWLSDIPIYPEFGFFSTGPYAETADLVHLPVENRPGRSDWALLFGEGYLPPNAPLNSGRDEYSGGYYVVGHFDGERFRRRTDSGALADPDDPLIDNVRDIDGGPDFYAPQTWFVDPLSVTAAAKAKELVGPEGFNQPVYRVAAPISNSRPMPAATALPRPVLGGWQSNWRYAHALPTHQWRGQLAVPRELSLRVTPRGVRLIQRPARQITSLRDGTRWSGWSQRDVNLRSGRPLGVNMHGSKSHEVNADIAMNDAESLAVHVNSGGEPGSVLIVWERSAGDAGTLRIDRSDSLPFPGNPPNGFAHPPGSPFVADDNRLRLRILVDRNSVEVFAGGGELVMSALYYPHPDNTWLTLTASGGTARLNALDVYHLTPNPRPSIGPSIPEVEPARPGPGAEIEMMAPKVRKERPEVKRKAPAVELKQKAPERKQKKSIRKIRDTRKKR